MENLDKDPFAEFGIKSTAVENKEGNTEGKDPFAEFGIKSYSADEQIPKSSAPSGQGGKSGAEVTPSKVSTSPLEDIESGSQLWKQPFQAKTEPVQQPLVTKQPAATAPAKKPLQKFETVLTKIGEKEKLPEGKLDYGKIYGGYNAAFNDYKEKSDKVKGLEDRAKGQVGSSFEDVAAFTKAIAPAWLGTGIQDWYLGNIEEQRTQKLDEIKENDWYKSQRKIADASKENFYKESKKVSAAIDRNADEIAKAAGGWDKLVKPLGQADVGKIRDSVDSFLEANNIPTDSPIAYKLRNEMKAKAEYKKIEPEINTQFEVQYKKKYGVTPEEDIQKEYGISIAQSKGIKDIKLGLEKQRATENESLKSEFQPEFNAVGEAYKVKSDELNARIETDPEIKSFADNLNKDVLNKYQLLVNQGKMTVEQANAEMQSKQTSEAINAQVSQKIQEKYGKAYESQFSEYQKQINEINSRYNSAYRRQEDARLSQANKKIEEEVSKFQGTFKPSEKLTKRREAAYGDAYRSVNEKYGKAQESVTRQLGHLRQTQSVISALGGGIKSYGQYFDNKFLYDLGESLESNNYLRIGESKELSDLTDMDKLVVGTGNIIGRMLPMIGVSTAVGFTTRNWSLASQMAIQGITGWLTEGADMAGSIKGEVLERTGDPVKADEAASNMWQSHIYSMPLYALSGLPYIEGLSSRVAKKVFPKLFAETEKGARRTFSQYVKQTVASGAVAGIGELSEEIPQEFKQGIDEEAIRNGTEIKSLADQLKVLQQGASFKRLSETFVQTAPSTLIMGNAPVYVSESYKYGKEKYYERGVDNYLNSASIKASLETSPEQYIYNTLAAKGKNFTGTLINTLYTSGNIDESTYDNLANKLASMNSFQNWLKKNKAEGKPTENIIGYNLHEKYYNAKKEFEESTDELGKDLLKDKMEKARDEFNGFYKGEGINAVVLTMGDGNQFVFTPDEINYALQFENIRDDIRNKRISVSAYTKKGQESVMEETLNEMKLVFQEKGTLESQRKKEEEERRAKLEEQGKIGEEGVEGFAGLGEAGGEVEPQKPKKILSISEITSITQQKKDAAARLEEMKKRAAEARARGEQIRLQKESEAAAFMEEQRKKRDAEVEELSAIRPDLTDDDMLLIDLPDTIDKVLDRLDANIPTDMVQVNEAIEALDKKFDQLKEYRNNPNRTHTTEQIDEVIDMLSEAKSQLQFYQLEIENHESRQKQEAGQGEPQAEVSETGTQPQAETEVGKPTAPVLEKYTASTDEKYGYIDRGDGKGRVELTKEDFLSEQAKMQPQGEVEIKQPTSPKQGKESDVKRDRYYNSPANRMVKIVADGENTPITEEQTEEIEAVIEKAKELGWDKDRLFRQLNKMGYAHAFGTNPEAYRNYLEDRLSGKTNIKVSNNYNFFEQLDAEINASKQKQYEQEKTKQENGEPMPEGVSSVRTEGEGGAQSTELRTEEEIAAKKADIERRRQEELANYDEGQLKDTYTAGSDKTIEEHINAKYDAELSALEQGKPTEEKEVKPSTELPTKTEEVVEEKPTPKALSSVEETTNALARDEVAFDKLFDKLSDNNATKVESLNLSPTEYNKKISDFNKSISTPNKLSEAYHKAKADGSNPELVKAVEDLLGKPIEAKPTEEKPTTKALSSVEETAKALKGEDVSELESKRLSNIELSSQQGDIKTGDISFAKLGDDIVDKVVAKDEYGNLIKVQINKKKLNGVLLERNGKQLFRAMQGRFFVIAKVGDFYLPFYISSAGTSGKVQGEWYPFFGYNNWLVKGRVGKGGEMEYTKKIDDVAKLLNENFKIPAKYFTQFGQIISGGTPLEPTNIFYDINNDIGYESWFVDFDRQKNNKYTEEQFIADRIGLNPKNVVNDGKGSADAWINDVISLTENASVSSKGKVLSSNLSEAYHKAKSKPENEQTSQEKELVKAVENLIGKPEEKVSGGLAQEEKTNLESIAKEAGVNFQEVRNVYNKYGEGKPLNEITLDDYKKAEEKRQKSKEQQPTKTQKDAVQEPSTTQEVSRNGEGGENKPEGGEGVGQGKQGEKAATESVQEKIDTLVDKTAPASERRKIMQENPLIKRIFDNIKELHNQLEEKGLITKKGNCP